MLQVFLCQIKNYQDNCDDRKRIKFK